MFSPRRIFLDVMAGPAEGRVPAIHEFQAGAINAVDDRAKPGHEDERRSFMRDRLAPTGAVWRTVLHHRHRRAHR